MTRNELSRRFPNMSESMIRQNLCEDALGKSEAPTPTQEISIKVENRKSTDEEKLNKLEAAWLAVLRGQGYDWIGIQNITIKLADDCRYTPDFSTVGNGIIKVFECKGFMRDDALVKIKVAARLFPWIRFILVTKSDGKFQQQLIKP